MLRTARHFQLDPRRKGTAQLSASDALQLREPRIHHSNIQVPIPRDECTVAQRAHQRASLDPIFNRLSLQRIRGGAKQLKERLITPSPGERLAHPPPHEALVAFARVVQHELQANDSDEE
jgi:hypothetical protein